MSSSDASPESPPPGRPAWWFRYRRLAWLPVLAGVVVLLWWSLRDELTLESLAAREQVLRDWLATRPAVVYPLVFLVYVLIVAVSIPGASVLTLSLGWYLGFWRGLVTASFASTAGATLAFLSSRYLLRAAVEQRFSDRVQAVNAALERDGPFYLLALRLAPVAPFFVINLVLGLTRMPVGTFWWVSQVGMLPATCLFVYAGSTVPTLAELAATQRPVVTWELIVALTLLGLLPLGVRYVLKLRRGEPPFR